MGMTIDKAILRVEHSSMSVDDKETADFIKNTMRKYQKIEEIVKLGITNELPYEYVGEKIEEVVEDGNDD